MWRALYGRVCLRYAASAPAFSARRPVRRAGLGVCVLPGDIEDELAVADDAGDVAVFRELEVDVALFPLGARKPSVDRRVRGDVALPLDGVPLVGQAGRKKYPTSGNLEEAA